jgi:F0F1-type ATP synthase assembly protein I
MPRQDSEPPMVVASRWVHQITTIALELALTAGAGFLLDKHFRTSPWLTVVGACFGLYVAGMSFVQLIKRLTPPPKVPPSSSPEKTSDNPGPSQQ